jgi:hypothetical protein
MLPPQPMPQQMQVPDNVVTIDKVMRLLQVKALRKFRIDIETDSTISGDEAQEKMDRQGLITSLVKLIEVSGPIVAAQPVMAPLMAGMMQFGIRAFRVGRELENLVEETTEKLEEMLNQPKPPPQPNPDELIKLQGTQAKVQAEIQKANIAVEEAKIHAQGQIMSHQGDMAALQAEHQTNQQQAQTDSMLAEQKARNDAASLQMKNQLEVMRYQRQIHAQNVGPDKG